MKTKITLLTLLLALTFSYSQSTPTLLHNNLQGDPFDIALHNNEIYISLPEEGKIVKVSLSSTNAPLVNVMTGLTYPTGLSFVNNELYFLEGADSNLTPFTGKLSKIDVSQENPAAVTIATGLNIPLEMATNSTNAYVIENNMDSEMMNVITASITNINLSTGSKTNVYTQSEDMQDIEILGSTLFFNNSGSDSNFGYIKKYNLTNNTVSTLFTPSSNQNTAERITINNGYVYFSNGYATSNIYRIQLGTGLTPQTVATNFMFGNDLAYANELIVDSNLLYTNAYSYNSTAQTDNYLLYKFDMTTLSAENFNATNNTISFYPNPVKESINFSKPIKDLEIYSLEGKKVTIPFTENKADASSLAKGIYMLNIADDNGNKSISKFIKD